MNFLIKKLTFFYVALLFYCENNFHLRSSNHVSGIVVKSASLPGRKTKKKTTAIFSKVNTVEGGRFEFLMAVKMSVLVFWVVTPFGIHTNVLYSWQGTP
jgi:hypothetical protein